MKRSLALGIAALMSTTQVFAADSLPNGTATSFTKKANEAVLKELDFNNKEDFELVNRGFIATLDNPIIKTARAPYDISAFEFTQNKPAPDTANPSLWRQSQLTSANGLYKLSDKVYQVRGLDISNMTLIQGNSGWIVIDPLTSTETSAAGMKLVDEKIGKRPIKAVIFTHSHADHFGGVMGIITQDDIKNKKVEIIAPAGFAEEAISENLYAGNIMSRRATFMYGNYLKNSPTENLGTGLGSAVSDGNHSFAMPTKTISKTGEKLTVDGVEMVFQMAPGTEAPSEMLFYFPQLKTLCLSEDATSTMHNLYTLRGAKVRSPLVWANALNTTLDMFPEAELSFASHHWPRWGKEKVRQHISDQRDMYKFINDQTLRLANMGFDSEEIAEQMKLPDSIGKKFYNRGYYGSLNHNVKATYQLYLGFYNGNPATLHEHPRTEAAKRYVEAMGGPAKVLRIGRTAFNKGDYRWTAEVLNHLVYANPNNKEARQLQAAALEQMGFQAESGPWRDVYLSGAKELRDGKLYDIPPIVDPRSLPLAMLFDFAGIRINPEKANGKTINLGVNATDTGEKYTVVINNSVLFAHKAKDGDKYDGTLEATTEQIGELFGGMASYDKLASDVKTTGRAGVIKDALALMDPMPKRIPLVTPLEKRAPQPSSNQMAQAKNE